MQELKIWDREPCCYGNLGNLGLNWKWISGFWLSEFQTAERKIYFADERQWHLHVTFVLWVL